MLLATGVLAAAPLLLAGCYESTDVTLHEPAVYKGKSDTQNAATRQEELRKRFELVQLDR